MYTSFTKKEFSLNEESMYELNSYIGRLFHYAKITDFRMISYNKHDIENFKQKIKAFEVNPEKFNLKDENVNKELWQAKYAIKSTVNSETGKTLPLVVRMCAFVPVNIPICFGLMCMPATFSNIIFFNFVNQTYNAAMNYSNGSGSQESIKFTSICYALAIVSSISTGLLLKKSFENKKSLNIFQEALIRTFPSMVAGFMNLFFMRSDYFTKGINIKDGNGNILGVSKRCGIKAVLEGALSRACIPIPIMLNIFFLKNVSKLNLPRKSNLAIELFSCTAALAVGLPFSIAIFKENSIFKTDYLEKELKANLKAYGQEYVFYNKGL